MANNNLARVPGFIQERAKECLKASDLLGVLSTMDNKERLFFVEENLLFLLDTGILEQAVIDVWSGLRVNSVRTESTFEFLFGFCDRQKLKACGDPLPGPGPFTLYRGRSGKGPARRIRGFSWTASFERAQRFAERPGLPDPAVYEVQAPESWILAYLNQGFRSEEEFIVEVPTEANIMRVWREIEG